MDDSGERTIGGRFILAGALIVLLALAVTAELLLRVFQRASAGVPMTAWVLRRVPEQFPVSPFLVFGPRTEWRVPNRPATGYAYFNAQGFRHSKPVEPKAPGEYRIITLGGSTTEDLWNEAGIHWPLVMECRLQQMGRNDVRVLNGGMSAYSSAHTLVRLEMDVLAYDPDLVIVMDNVNDLTVNYVAEAAGVAVDPNYHVKYGRPEYTSIVGEADVVPSRLWNAIRARLRPGDKPQELHAEAGDISGGLAVFERNLRSMAAIARAHDVGLIFLTMPVADSDSLYSFTQAGFRAGRPQVGPLPPRRARFESDFAAYNESIERVGTATGTPVIRMHAELGADPAHFGDVVHYTTLGSITFGTAAARALEPLLPALTGAPAAGNGSSARACGWEKGAPSAQVALNP